MIDNEFQRKFGDWKQRLLSNKMQYGDNVWENLNSHPLDFLLLELADLYQLADERQKLTIENFIEATHLLSWQLVLFIRRIAKLLDSFNKEKMVNTGLTIASIVSKKDDFRDVIVSLILLKYAAEKLGMVIKPSIDTEMKDADETFTNILESTINTSQASTVWTVKSSVRGNGCMKWNHCQER